MFTFNTIPACYNLSRLSISFKLINSLESGPVGYFLLYFKSSYFVAAIMTIVHLKSKLLIYLFIYFIYLFINENVYAGLDMKCPFHLHSIYV